MFEHAVAAVRGDDRQRRVLRVGHRVVVREVHRARWKAVIWLSSRSVVMKACAVKLPGTTRTCSRRGRGRQAVQIWLGVVADRRHDERIAAEQLQVVGDVAGAAAENALDVGNQETDVQDVDLVRQDAVLEAVFEDHDVVVGDGTAMIAWTWRAGVVFDARLSGIGAFLWAASLKDMDFDNRRRMESLATAS